MRDQYAGDISDLLKYALLRHLAAGNRPLGVAWFARRTPRRVLGREKWIGLDSGLWQALKALPSRSVVEVERLPIWPTGSIFHRVPVATRALRAPWAAEMVRGLSDCDLIFVDPDNGLGRATPRHTTLDELKSLRCHGRVILLIKFPGRVSFDRQEDAYHDLLRKGSGATDVITLRTSVAVSGTNGHSVPRCRWFTLLDHNAELADRMSSFATRLNGIDGATASIRKK